MLGQELIGKRVIVRTYSAGVHFGTLAARDGKEVQLTNTRRLWYWEGAFTLSKVAESGIKHKGSKISVAVQEILLTEAIEVIPVSAIADENITSAPTHTPE